jgi:hypothetical protein
MNKYRITAKATIDVIYYIEAETEAEARTKWEDIDPSMGSLCEDSVDTEEFHSITCLGPCEIKNIKTVLPLPAGNKDLEKLAKRTEQIKTIMVGHMTGNQWLSWPDEWPEYHNANVDACDVAVGPCACGATHLIDEFRFDPVDCVLYRYGEPVAGGKQT